MNVRWLPSRSEIKNFKRIVKAIHEADLSKGHSSAIADFIDAEFSDNTGMVAKARRSPAGGDFLGGERITRSPGSRGALRAPPRA